MALDRQFIVEVADAQGNLVAKGSVFLANTVGSRITSATAGAAASLVTWAGNGQSAVAGATVTPPAVRVLDAAGLPVAGSTVTWEGNIISGATQQGLTGTTDANGVVTLGGWSVGTTAGSASTVFAYSGNLTNSPLRFSITPTAGSAFSCNVNAGGSQNTTPVTALTSRLTVLVADQYKNPVTGATVTWSSSDADAAFGAATSVTNSSGLAGVVYTTGQSASTASVYGAISSATSARFGIGTYAAAPTEVTIVSGNNQTALSGATLANPLVVGVSDGYGNPWSSGQTLQFVVVAGSGNVSSATSTPASGVAQVTWAMGATAGINLLEVSLAGISNSTITFTASGTNPVADTIQVESGNNQSGTVAAALSLPLAVATLGSGSSASGQVVVWSVDSGSLSTTITKSSTSGIARTVWTLPTGAGTYAASASAGTLTGSPVAFAATATAGTVTKLVVTTQPSSNPQPGVAWPQQPVVVSADQYGNPVSTNTRVGAVLASGDGVLASAVSTYAVASGATATFSGLSYTYVTSPTFQLEFEARSLSTATATAQVSQPPFASQLAFTTQPTGGSVDGTIGTVLVAVQDSNGNTVTNATNAVTVSLTAANNTEGATLSGTLSQAASSGIATFAGLSVDVAGSYTLDAAATGLTGTTSSSFNVTAGTSDPNRPTDVTWTTAATMEPTSDTNITANGFRLDKGTLGTHLGTAAGTTYSVNNGHQTLSPGAGPVDASGRILWQKVRSSGQAQGSLARIDVPTFPSATAKSLFFDFTVQMAADWDGHTSNQCKLAWYAVSSPNGTPYEGILSVWGANQGTIGARPYFQGTQMDRSGVASPTATLTRGTWHRLQFLFVAESSVGANNGLVKWWKDGTLIGTISDMDFGGTTLRLPKFEWYWGGTGDSAPWDLYLFHDYIKISYSASRSAG